jgi:hypothetical protein
LSLFAGSTTGVVDWPISFSIDDCHSAEYSHHRFICVSARRYGFESIFAVSSRNAWVRPNSSVTIDLPAAVCLAMKSPRTLALLSAALASDSASATGS